MQIAKYVSLRGFGFAAEDLRLVVLRDIVRELPHAVLAVYLKGEVYILDNLTTAVAPQEQLSQYVPYYSINETTRWAHVPPADTVVSSSPARLSSAAAERAPPRAVPELASALAQSEDSVWRGSGRRFWSR